jgi:hypothetical protein
MSPSSSSQTRTNQPDGRLAWVWSATRCLSVMLIAVNAVVGDGLDQHGRRMFVPHRPAADRAREAPDGSTEHDSMHIRDSASARDADGSANPCTRRPPTAGVLSSVQLPTALPLADSKSTSSGAAVAVRLVRRLVEERSDDTTGRTNDVNNKGDTQVVANVTCTDVRRPTTICKNTRRGC